MSFKLIRRIGLSIAISATLLSVAQAETVKLAVTDLVGLEELQREFGAFRDVLSKATGYDIVFQQCNTRATGGHQMFASARPE